MKYLLTLPLFLILTSFVWGQQGVNPLQYQQSLANSNAGFVGVNEGVTFSSLAHFRNQTPELRSSFKSLQIDLPVRFYSMGIGFSATQRIQGNNELSRFKLAYSYKIRFLEGILSFGSFVGLSQYKYNFSGQTIRSLNDPTLIDNSNRLAPLLSAGLFYRNKNLSLGLSSDNLIKNDLSLEALQSESESTRNLLVFVETKHKLNSKLVLKPSLYSDSQSNAPLNLAFASTLEIDTKYWVNAGYRMKADLFFSAGVDFNRLISGFSQPIKLGFAYSVPAGHQVITKGTAEIFLSYNYAKRPNPEKIRNQKRIVSPIIFY